jgi:phosphoribosyl-ATP pyrophosphohydrolase
VSIQEHWNKIILTTDEELILDGVQEIEEDFLEWFENNPCEAVKVQKWSSLADCGYSYHVTLPRAGAKQKTRKYSEREVLAMLLMKHDGLSPEYVLEQFKAMLLMKHDGLSPEYVLEQFKRNKREAQS